MLAGFDDDNSDDNDDDNDDDDDDDEDDNNDDDNNDDDGDDDKGKPPHLKIAGKQVRKTKVEKVENKLNKS